LKNCFSFFFFFFFFFFSSSFFFFSDDDDEARSDGEALSAPPSITCKKLLPSTALNAALSPSLSRLSDL
jgi:hypothetical protein